MVPRLGARNNYTFYPGQAPSPWVYHPTSAAVLRSGAGECFVVFGEKKVTILLVILSLSAPAITLSTRNKTLSHVPLILSSF